MEQNHHVAEGHFADFVPEWFVARVSTQTMAAHCGDENITDNG